MSNCRLLKTVDDGGSGLTCVEFVPVILKQVDKLFWVETPLYCLRIFFKFIAMIFYCQGCINMIRYETDIIYHRCSCLNRNC